MANSTSLIPMSWRSEDTVKVIVGQSKVQFTVPARMLCGRSGFFRAALGSSWKEAQIREVQLPEDDPDVFDQYLNLLHTGMIHRSVNDEDSVDRKREEYKVEENVKKDLLPMDLLQVYVLGDKLCDGVTMNIITDMVLRTAHDSVRWRFSEPCIDYLCERLSVTTPLCKLLVDIVCTGGSPQPAEGKTIGFPLEFASAVIVQFVAIRDFGRPGVTHVWPLNACDYHDHSNVLDCPRVDEPIECKTCSGVYQPHPKSNKREATLVLADSEDSDLAQLVHKEHSSLRPVGGEAARIATPRKRLRVRGYK